MYRSVYDLKAFYNSKPGRVVRRILQERIREMWPDIHNMRVMGCGYAVPYLRAFMDEAERVFAVMPAGQGVHAWPQGSGVEKNLSCISEEGTLPVENASIDRLLMIHHIEFSEALRDCLSEAWRVLKANGRLLVIVPNRSGLWAHADWSPFGQGTPYSARQLGFYLHDNRFVRERTEEALFMPPLQYSLMLKSAGFFEKTGRVVAPFMAGLHMVEAGKQVFAGVESKKSAKEKVRGGNFMPSPAS